MSEPEQTYGPERERALVALLRNLASRIQELDRQGRLLSESAELVQLTGDVRSELFHYEVRATYDTPEVAESRRIVADAIKNQNSTWHNSEWTPGADEPREW